MAVSDVTLRLREKDAVKRRARRLSGCSTSPGRTAGPNPGVAGPGPGLRIACAASFPGLEEGSPGV